MITDATTVGWRSSTAPDRPEVELDPPAATLVVAVDVDEAHLANPSPSPACWPARPAP